jgi:hypothetical protein
MDDGDPISHNPRNPTEAGFHGVIGRRRPPPARLQARSSRRTSRPALPEARTFFLNVC